MVRESQREQRVRVGTGGRIFKGNNVEFESRQCKAVAYQPPCLPVPYPIHPTRRNDGLGELACRQKHKFQEVTLEVPSKGERRGGGRGVSLAVSPP